jgi:hypothetical protein
MQAAKIFHSQENIVACFGKNVRESLLWDRFGRFKTNRIRLIF